MAKLRWLSTSVASVCAVLVLISVWLANAAVGEEPSPEAWLALQDYSFAPAPSVDEMISDADAIIAGTVEGISGPFWNSIDRAYWEGSPDIPTDVYSEVLIRVTDVLVGPVDEPVIDLLVYGDGWAIHDGDGLPTWAAISGGFSVGSEVVVALRKQSFDFEGGEEVRWSLDGQFQANWTVTGNDLANKYPPFSMTMSALMGIVEAVRRS